MSYANTVGPINDLYVFLRKMLPFGGRDDCTGIKMSSGVNFSIAINFIAR